MLKFLDVEVEELKSYPKADYASGQGILDEVENMVKGHASDLKQELCGQLASTAGTVAQFNAYCENRLIAAESRIAQFFSIFK